MPETCNIVLEKRQLIPMGDSFSVITKSFVQLSLKCCASHVFVSWYRLKATCNRSQYYLRCEMLLRYEWHARFTTPEGIG